MQVYMGKGVVVDTNGDEVEFVSRYQIYLLHQNLEQEQKHTNKLFRICIR